MRAIQTEGAGDLGFQIAPMIDVVFVIMLFFMVMAGAIKVENHLVTNLPARSESDSTEFVDETIIGVAEDGEVTLNDEPVDTATATDLRQLKASLNRLKQNADDSKNQVVITIVSEPQAKYSRVVDVLDALTYAKITNVTFTVADEE
ncbi:MAG: ExbD/TolR family protein [Verrucomicrobiales bacterium]